MTLKRIWILFNARNREFFRDRAAFGWNFLFPFLIIAGFGVVFGGSGQQEYKVGLFPFEAGEISEGLLKKGSLPENFRNLRHTTFVGFETKGLGMDRLKHHKIDILVELDSIPRSYWINSSSPKGYFMERIYNGSIYQDEMPLPGDKRAVEGGEIRYLDWFFPGILSMNMMFSALYGVGYVIVRYRRNGVLKRLKATPVTAFEYICAQLISRIFLVMFTLVIVWAGCDILFSFKVKGSYLTLFIIFLTGSISLSSLGLLIACRGSSEEFASGVLNFISWPMMFMSEVWFSLEGAPLWVKNLAQIFPLTHMIRAARLVMNEGAGIHDVNIEIMVMLLMTLVFLSVSSVFFSWTR